MKFAITLLVLAVVAVANCQDEETGKLSEAQILDIIKANNPELTCVNMECRHSCVNGGSKTGYCAAGVCNCVPAEAV